MDREEAQDMLAEMNAGTDDKLGDPDEFCLTCDKFDPYGCQEIRDPDNCSRWLCNCGSCPHDAEIKARIPHYGEPEFFARKVRLDEDH